MYAERPSPPGDEMGKESEDLQHETELPEDFQDARTSLLQRLRIPISSIVRYAGLTR